MSWVLSLEEIDDSAEAGGKARALAALKRQGVKLPDAICIPASAYRYFVQITGLDQQINLELGKKDFANMRWEELWDISLRLRNGFNKGAMPGDLSAAIEDALEERYKGVAVSVRSSSLAEDSAQTSFAGMHESFVNLSGAESIIRHIKLVWASLWSDRALLYRQELGLDPFSSAMGVVVQRMVFGDSSGVTFSMNPMDSSRASLEAVYGLNQGLVDGSIEPDHWELDRKNGEIIEHRPARRQSALRPIEQGVEAEALSGTQKNSPPLTDQEVISVYGLSRKLEESFGAPQDMEWTKALGETYVLQARNITTIGSEDADDDRPRYLGLKRSLEDLKALRKSIQDELIPGMQRQADDLATIDLTSLDDQALASELERRQSIVRDWVAAYWRECIPFAHGMRLFGQVYNDQMEPEDPYEFMTLLAGVELESLQRNQRLKQMGEMISTRPELAAAIESGVHWQGFDDFTDMVDGFIEAYGDASWGNRQMAMNRSAVARLAVRFAGLDAGDRAGVSADKARLEKAFLESFAGSRRNWARELLDIGRASYQLRDDDNIFLGRLEGHLARAKDQGLKRLEAVWGPIDGAAQIDAVVRALREHKPIELEPGSSMDESHESKLPTRARQLVGQPASSGIATGRARVVRSPEDLFKFEEGEVLVCDAIDPNMTFIVPLASAIVERRGGMLIHGAIIAREQGIPCVTGVPEAAALIKDGDLVSVDGYLGIVTIGENSLRAV
jgi:phosphohistidine swiveling domain-containing protein